MLNKDCSYTSLTRIPSVDGSTVDGSIVDDDNDDDNSHGDHSLTPAPELSLAPIQRTSEVASLQQFCMSTSLAVFKNLGLPFHTFWTSAVPKLSISEACVAHIMVALAARQRATFHVSESAERPHLIRVHNRHYSEACRMLCSTESRQKPEMILLCCLMFISMENVEDTVANNFLHLKSGLQVLREYKAQKQAVSPTLTRSATDLIEDTLEPMFARLEAVVSPTIYSITDDQPAQSLIWEMPRIPRSFENLATVRGSLWEIAQWVFSQGNHQMLLHSPQPQEFFEMLELCDRWNAVFEKYQIEHPREMNQYVSSVIAITTNYQLLVLLIKCTAVPNELLWMKHHQTLEEILRNTQVIQREGLARLPLRRTLMNILPRMMPALFTVAVLCRSQRLQMEAIELLEKTHSDYHDDQCFVTVIARGIILLEETLQAGNFMQLSNMESRIRPLKAELQPGRPGRIVLTYIRPFVRALVADDPVIGPIITGPPEEHVELPWRSEEAPPGRTVWLWPVIEFLRLIGSSGLVGANTGHCLCRTYGALFALMR